MEYVVGPVIALLLGMKFTDFRDKKAAKEHAAKHDEMIEYVDEKIVASNTQMSQQTLKLMMPLAKSMTAVNKQLGLWTSKRLSPLLLDLSLRMTSLTFMQHGSGSMTMV